MKHLEFVKINQTVSDSYIPGSNYYYLNENASGPKILLASGWSKISEFVEILKRMKPLKPLEYNPKLNLKISSAKADWTNKEIFLKFISDKKEELKLNKINFHFDIGYLDAETCAVLQLVDDNLGFNGSRRKNILNSEVNQVGVSNVTSGLKNCTYVIFTKMENQGNKLDPKDQSTNFTNV